MGQQNEEIMVTFDFAPPNESPARFFMTRQTVGDATEVYTVHPTSEEGDVMLEMEGGYFDEIYDRAFEVMEAEKESRKTGYILKEVL